MQNETRHPALHDNSLRDNFGLFFWEGVGEGGLSLKVPQNTRRLYRQFFLKRDATRMISSVPSSLPYTY